MDCGAYGRNGIDVGELGPRWLAEFRAFPEEFQGVMIAVSGHLDSIALFDIFYQISKLEKKFFHGAIHLNYGLRGSESDADQKLIENLASDCDVPLHCFHPRSDRNSAHGTQEWARHERKAVFSDFTKRGFVIATAHHADDAAETGIFRLTRGASIGHALGLRRYKDGMWRPLLNFTKEQIHQYAMDSGLRWREDHTNLSLRYSRNRIRHQVLPVLEEMHRGAATRIADTLREGQELYEFAKSNHEQNIIHEGENCFKLPCAAWPTWPTTVRMAACDALMERAGLPFEQHTRRHLKGFLSSLTSQKPLQKLNINRSWQLLIEKQAMSLRPAPLCTKANRYAQHQRSLFHRPIRVVLPSQASISLSDSHGRKSIVVQSKKWLSPKLVRVYPEEFERQKLESENEELCHK